MSINRRAFKIVRTSMSRSRIEMTPAKVAIDGYFCFIYYFKNIFLTAPNG